MKNSNLKRILSVALVCVMLASTLSLFGCGGGENPNLATPTLESTADSTSAESTSENENTETTALTTDTESETTSAETVAEGKLPYGTVFQDRVTEHTIVYALYSGTAVQSSVDKLIDAFEDKCTVHIASKKENAYNTANPGMTGKKIVVGYLEKDETAMEIYNSLHTPDSYIIKYVNNSLYIIGGSGDSTAEAVDYFISTYLKIIRTKLEFEDGVIRENNEEPRFKNLTIAGNSVDKYVIVYDNTSMGLRYAKEMRSAISAITGRSLNIKKQDMAQSEYEILIGKTNRAESQQVRADYDRPNIYYDVEVVGKKLVCMGEGWHTLAKLVPEFEKHFGSRDLSKTDLTGTVISGNVKNDIDTTDMLDRAENTDIRVFNYNVFGPTYDFVNLTMFTDDYERGMAIADVVLAYYPDVFTTNELFPGHAEYEGINSQLLEYYDLVDSTEEDYDYGFPNDSVSPETMAGYCGVPEQIYIKKSCNFKIIDNGWRYWSKYIDAPDSWHGVHWAVLETEAGQKFIVTAGHYGDGTKDETFAREHQLAIDMAQERSGSTEILPTIAAGDFFSAPNQSSYNYHIVTKGFTNPQLIKDINRNFTIYQATCHKFGKSADSGTQYDFIFHNGGFTPLKFKVLKSKLLNYTSDHYPEVVDLKFS